MNHSEAGKLGAIKSNQTQLLKFKQNIIAYNENPTKCLNCNRTLPYDKRHNKFCNQSCSATYNNKLHPKRNKIIKNQYSPGYKPKHSIPKYCIFCNKLLSDNQKKFCNYQCQQDYNWQKKKEKIELNNGFAGDYRRLAKRYLSDVHGCKCAVCGITEWCDRPVPLVLDHIDGNSENNTLDNLRLVCGNCDMQLPTYKNRNMGNGRQWRRQRYADGKSY